MPSNDFNNINFDFDSVIEEKSKTLPINKDTKGDFAQTMKNMIRPYYSTILTAAESLNTGMGVFSAHLDTIADYIGEKTGTESLGVFENAAKFYDKNAEYWRKKAEKNGVTFLDEFFGEAIGGAVPGVGEFLLNVPYSAMLGAAETEEGSELAGAFVEGAKRGVLGLIFKAISPLKQYLRAPTMGTVFGVQTMAEGGDKEDIYKSFGTGAFYSILSPGGKMGLNELKNNIRPKIEIAEKRARKAQKRQEYIKVQERMAGFDPDMKNKRIRDLIEKKRKKIEALNAKEAKEMIHEMIIDRRANINLGSYETNLVANEIEKITTRTEREALYFIREKTDVPKELKRPDIEKILQDKAKLKKLKPIADKLGKHFEKGFLNMKKNIPNFSVDQIENYITHIWDIPKAKQQNVSNWFVTQNRFLKKRFINTVKEGVDKFNLKPKTLDVVEVMRIHDSMMTHVIENIKFAERLNRIKYDGFKLIERADKAPDDWVVYNHPALQRTLFVPGEKGAPDRIKRVMVKVHPDLKKPLDVIFGSPHKGQVIQAYEILNGLFKKSWLSLSFFHGGALGEVGVATMGLTKTGKLYLPVKIYNALAKNEFDAFKKAPIARDGIKHTLQLGATEDIPVAMIQDKLNTLANRTKDVKVINRATEFLRTFNENWDRALWSHLHDSLKVYAYETLVSKLAIEKHGSAESIRKRKTEIAQFINDTAGGQNWDTLMVSPQTLQYMKWSLLSPDWTVSTIRQALSVTGYGKIYEETKWLRKAAGRRFWIRAGLYYGLGQNMLNYIFRKWDEEKNPQYYKDIDMNFLDRTMLGNPPGKKTSLFVGRYDDGTERYARTGKQFKEVPELFWTHSGDFNPLEAAPTKLGGKGAPTLQIGSEILFGHTLSGYMNKDIKEAEGMWEQAYAIIKTLAKAPLPFAVKNMFQEDKEFKASDFILPSSRGLTKHQAIKQFKLGIKSQEIEHIRQMFIHSLRNNLPAYSLFKQALSSIKAEATKEYNKNIENLNDAVKKLKEADTILEVQRLERKIKALRKEKIEKQIGMALLEKAIIDAEVYKTKRGKK